MRALDRKLLRDLWQIRGQALAIAAVIGAGVALYVMTLSAFDSLDRTQHAYYSSYRFADLFGACKRAPLRLDVRLRVRASSGSRPGSSATSPSTWPACASRRWAG